MLGCKLCKNWLDRYQIEIEFELNISYNVNYALEQYGSGYRKTVNIRFDSFFVACVCNIFIIGSIWGNTSFHFIHCQYFHRFFFFWRKYKYYFFYVSHVLTPFPIQSAIILINIPFTNDKELIHIPINMKYGNGCTKLNKFTF